MTFGYTFNFNLEFSNSIWNAARFGYTSNFNLEFSDKFVTIKLRKKVISYFRSSVKSDPVDVCMYINTEGVCICIYLSVFSSAFTNNLRKLVI